MTFFSKLLFILTCIVFMIGCAQKNGSDTVIKQNPTVSLNFIYGIGRVVPENDIMPIYSAVGGMVTKIFVHENDTLREGDIILELDHQLEDERLSQVENSIISQTAQIAMDMALVEEMEAQRKNAETELSSLEKLGLISAISKKSIDDLRTKVEVLKANIKGGLARVSFSKSKKKEIESELRIARIHRDQKIVKAQVNGILLELSALLGEVISTSISFGAIQPEGRIIAICEIDEASAYLVRIGQKGWIRNKGTLDTLSRSEIFFTSSSLNTKSLFFDQAGERQDRRVRKVKLSLENTSNLLLNTRIECVIMLNVNQ